MPVIVRDAPGDGHSIATLDISERQLVQEFPDLFPSHHRVLLIHIEGPRWIVGTPTQDVFEEDFSGEAVVPVERASQFPLAGRPIFAFSPLTELELTSLRSRAIALAAVLGITVGGLACGSDSKWLFADPASERFSQEVPPGMMTGTTHIRGSKGMVESTIGGETVIEFMEQVNVTDIEEWKSEKRIGAGRDVRLAGARMSDTAAIPLFRELAAALVPPTTAAPVFQGPPAAAAVVKAMIASGHEPAGYQASWVSASGVSPKSGLCIEHALLVNVLYFLLCVDGLNIYSSTGVELLCRRLLQIQRAVRKNPRAPDFEGLESYTAHGLDSTGGALALEFDKHVASTQRDTAFIMKQMRLNREEQDAEGTRKSKANAKNKAKASAEGEG